MKNNLVNQDIKTDKLDFSIRNNSEAWLTIPADGGQITFTGNADDAAKEFFNALIRERDGYISALKAERDASLNAERAWETSMMAVCGEDGPGSVAAVIKALAVENAALIEGLRCIYTTALIAQDSGPETLYSWDFANQPAEEIEMWISDAKETYAALSAIEARGVEKFADFLGKQYQCEKANTAKGKAYKHVVFLACRFANELQVAK